MRLQNELTRRVGARAGVKPENMHWEQNMQSNTANDVPTVANSRERSRYNRLENALMNSQAVRGFKRRGEWQERVSYNRYDPAMEVARSGRGRAAKAGVAG